MKNLVMLMLSINALYAADSKKENEYSDPNAMLKPSPTEHAPHDEAQKMYDKFNDYLHSDETKYLVGAALTAGRTAWGYVKPVFWNEKADTPKNGNIFLAMAIGGAYWLGLRHRNRAMLNQMKSLLKAHRVEMSEEMAKNNAELHKSITLQGLGVQQTVGDVIMRSKGLPTAP